MIRSFIPSSFSIAGALAACAGAALAAENTLESLREDLRFFTDTSASALREDVKGINPEAFRTPLLREETKAAIAAKGYPKPAEDLTLVTD